jgi:SAM-dependent methyltransferase
MSNFTEQMFTAIYEQVMWGDQGGETRSGESSTLVATEPLRKELPELFKKFDITSVLDAPCGDFNWMRIFMKDHPEIQYTGADIVGSMIEKLKLTDTTNNQKFVQLDITKDQLPDVDLLICRDCLFHFEQQLVGDFIRNFADSNIKYLLTTTHHNDGSWSNANINTGGFHTIDLFLEPYNFNPNVLYSIEDWIPTQRPRQLCLWSQDQIRDLL